MPTNKHKFFMGDYVIHRDDETITYSTSKAERSLSRSPEEMKHVLETREARKQTAPIYDENNNPVADLDYDFATKDIIGVRPYSYENLEQSAEKPSEHIYLTDEKGEILDIRATRGEARERNERYLIVTSLLFHGNKVLTQQRSMEKALDPGKISASAHGVAKELQLQAHRINNVETASVINMALELNEELRHGANTTPFQIKLWPGTKDELIKYAETCPINNPNEVYLVPEALLNDDAYPLGSKGNKRTRGVFTAFIFSGSEPPISIDPAELSGIGWRKMSEYANDPSVTEDMQSATSAIIEQWIADSSQNGSLGKEMAKKALRSHFNLN